MIRQPQINAPNRRGFTLLEILIALGLMVFLVGAISQAISMYSTLSTLGREETEQSQIGRAVLGKMARDIKSVTFTKLPEMEMSTDDLGGEEAMEEGGGDLGDFLDEEDDLSSDSGPAPATATGLIGTVEELTLHIRRVDRVTQYIPSEEAVSPRDRINDQLTIKYFLAKPGGGGVSGQFARKAQGPAAAIKDVVGLARTEGDRTSLSKAIDEEQIDPQVDATKLIAAEVIALRFRYFSNGQWYDEWDSTELNKMPQAVEVKISVQLQPEEERSRFEAVDPNEEEGLIREYVRVVAIPVVPSVDMEEL